MLYCLHVSMVTGVLVEDGRTLPLWVAPNARVTAVHACCGTHSMITIL